VKLDPEVSNLRSQLAAYKVEEQIYRDAMSRNEVMAGQISSQATSANRSIPIAFIGNFHTSAITASLRAQGIGYVVVEPRFSTLTDSQEKSEFDRYVNPAGRQSYISSVTTQNKGPVAPTIAEVRNYYDPLIDRVSRRLTLADA